MIKKTLTKKLLKLKAETIAQQMFRTFADRIEFNIMDVGKVLRAAENIILAGGTEDEAEAAIKAAIEKYRVAA